MNTRSKLLIFISILSTAIFSFSSALHICTNRSEKIIKQMNISKRMLIQEFALSNSDLIAEVSNNKYVTEQYADYIKTLLNE